MKQVNRSCHRAQPLASALQQRQCARGARAASKLKSTAALRRRELVQVRSQAQDGDKYEFEDEISDLTVQIEEMSKSVEEGLQVGQLEQCATLHTVPLPTLTNHYRQAM